MDEKDLNFLKRAARIAIATVRDPDFAKILSDENDTYRHNTVELLKLLAGAYEAVVAQQAWQPIETVPNEPGVPVLLLYPGGPSIAAWHDDPDFAEPPGAWSVYLGPEDYCAVLPEEPSHWMPLPSLPA